MYTVLKYSKRPLSVPVRIFSTLCCSCSLQPVYRRSLMHNTVVLVLETLIKTSLVNSVLYIGLYVCENIEHVCENIDKCITNKIAT